MQRGDRARRSVATRLVLTGLLLAVLAVWVLVPHPLEGPVLFSLSTDHGIHLGDLAGLAVALGVAWWLW
ncbi:MAG: hypothetical protein HY828_16775 [Actinobacteria bacterium]|nr:hypothetical protein [Actinomycetota bacterium]